ncbi:MAG: signal transduction histidine kinase [Nitriliruptoraceae bacterium]|jgi:signal transduction histidine kinase
MGPRNGGHDTDGAHDPERLTTSVGDGGMNALIGEEVDLGLRQVDARRRRMLALAAFAGLGSASIAAATLMLDGIVLPWWVGWALLATTAVFFLDVFTQERTLQALTRAAVAAQSRGRALEATVADLTALRDVARRVHAVLLPEQIYAEVLAGAVELLGASQGSIRLRVADRLGVAAAQGEGAPMLGSAVVMDLDPAVVVVTLGTTVLEEAPPRLVVPVTVGLRHVGVLEVARPDGAAQFPLRQVLLAQLFAAEAATAFVNANRYDHERLRADEAVAASQTRAEAVADTVHDLRAPLAGVYGYAQLLQRRADSLTQAQHATIVAGIVDESARLVRLVDEVFEAATAEARAAAMRDPLDLGRIAVSVVAGVQASATGAGRDLTIELEVADDAIVLADRETLTRIVTNLVANAAEHGGGVVMVRVQRRGSEVRLHVADRGDGIAPEAMHELFRRRLGVARGRGLSIVDGLVRAVGGRISVRSQPGVGTVFTVRLPAAPR